MSTVLSLSKIYVGQFSFCCNEQIDKIEKLAVGKDRHTAQRVAAAFKEIRDKLLSNPEEEFVFSDVVLISLKKETAIFEELNELVDILKGRSELYPLAIVKRDGDGRGVESYSVEELQHMQKELCACVAIKVRGTIQNLTKKREATKEEHEEITRRSEEVRAQNLARIELARRRSTFEGALELVTENGLNLEHLNPVLQRDKRIALAAVRQNGLALQFVHPDLKNDREVVMTALRNGDADIIIQFAGEEFLANRERVLEAIRNNEMAICYGQEALVEDRAFIIDALRENPMVLQLLSEPLRNDYELAVIGLQGVDEDQEELFIANIVGNEIRPRMLAERQRGNEVIAAARSGDIDRVQTLLADGATMFAWDRGFSIIQAAKRGHQAIVQALLANGPISEEDRGEAVVKAVEKQRSQNIIDALLANGPISEEDRGKAVWCAVSYGRQAIVQALLANGPISEEDRGESVIEAAKGNQQATVEALLANGATISEVDRGQAIRFAASSGLLAMVEALLPEGVTIPEEDRGWAVVEAANKSYKEIVKALLPEGVTISVRDRFEAVKAAMYEEDLEMFNTLLASGDISTAFRGRVLEAIASVYWFPNRCQFLQALLANGAEISQFARGAAVRKAAEKGDIDFMQELLANGAEIPEQYRESAVKIAARRNRQDMIVVLLSNATISAEAKEQAIQMAEEMSYHAIAEFLRESS